MSTPFFFVDRKVGPRDAFPTQDRPVVQRNQPERLTLSYTGNDPVLPHDVIGPPAPPRVTDQPRVHKGGWLTRWWSRPTRSPAH